MKILTVVVFLLLVAPISAQEGSKTVYGSSKAQECYMQTKLDLTHSGGAIELCTEALREDMLSRQDRARTLVNRGTNYNNVGRIDQAMEDVENALRVSPNLAEAYLTRGNSYALRNDLEPALADYNRAIELGLEDQHSGYFNRGITYHSLKRYEEAYADFKSATQLKPEWDLPRQYIGVYQTKFGYQ